MGEEKVTLIVDSRAPGLRLDAADRELGARPDLDLLANSSPSGTLPLAGVSAPAMTSRSFRSSFSFWTGSVR